MARKKSKGTQLSVFKGKEAKLNRAIFKILAIKEPLIIYDIHKKIRSFRGFRRTRYGTVNKRVRALTESEYIKKKRSIETKAGFEANTYELSARTYLALALDSISLEELLELCDEENAIQFIADLAKTLLERKIVVNAEQKQITISGPLVPGLRQSCLRDSRLFRKAELLSEL